MKNGEARWVNFYKKPLVSSAVDDFDQWYEQNRSYYAAKHSNDEEAMRSDALSAHGEIMRFISAPPVIQRSRKIKEKPNPYGFR